MEADASNVVRVSLKSKDWKDIVVITAASTTTATAAAGRRGCELLVMRGVCGGFNVIELNGVVASGGEVLFVR